MKKSFFRALIALLLLAALMVSALGGCGLDAGTGPSPGGAPADSAPVGDALTTEDEQPAETPPDDKTIDPEGEYTSPEEVAEYIHTYGRLPANFITKSQAQDLGWDSQEGNLDEVAPGKSIGGDRFGNREGLLPEGVEYRECDVNYTGGYRGGERLVYGDDGSVYYTADHYASFEKLY